MHHPKADTRGDRLHVKKQEEEQRCYKLKRHTEQRELILQNICTQNINKTSLQILIKATKSNNI